MYTHLLVPTDGSPLSDHALDQALALARALGARVTLFTVVEPFHAIAYTPEQVVESASSYEAHARAAADRRLQEAAARAAAAGVAHRTEVAMGEDPHEAIIAAARRQIAVKE